MGEDVLRDVHHPIGLGERRTARTPVVEHESAFIHLRKESRAHEVAGDHASDDEEHGARDH